MEHFDALPALAGGGLIGLAASILLLFNGRIAGISGILGGLLTPSPGDVAWRLTFLGGLVAGGLGCLMLAPELMLLDLPRSPGAVLLAGLLVGVGTRLGGGCTSGHGVCGIARLSVRSTVAVLTFMLTGAVAAGLVHHLFGGVV